MELTGGYEQLRIADPDHILRLAGLTTILYLLMSYPLSLSPVGWRNARQGGLLRGGAAMIAVRGLVKDFGNGRVLNGASLDVRPGEVAVVIGLVCCGKSTYSAASTAETFQAGEIQVGELRCAAASWEPNRTYCRCVVGWGWCSSSSTCFRT